MNSPARCGIVQCSSLFQTRESNETHWIRSGVLITVSGETYLASAAHVFAAEKNGLWTPQENQVVSKLQVTPFLTGDPTLGEHQHDPIDAGVLRISPSITSLRTRVRELILLDRGKPVLFVLLGFAASRTESDLRAGFVQSERMPLILGEVTPEEYTKAGFDPRTHLLLRYRKHWKGEQGRTHARSLRGCSGGGIWKVAPTHKADPPRLVATYTACQKVAWGRVHVATRIGVHLNLIRQIT